MKNRQKRLLNNRIAALMLSAALVAPVLTAFMEEAPKASLWRHRRTVRSIGKPV